MLMAVEYAISRLIQINTLQVFDSCQQFSQNGDLRLSSAKNPRTLSLKPLTLHQLAITQATQQYLSLGKTK